MRVIAGHYGGRQLVAPAGMATRPTGDKVREALFSMLGPLDGRGCSICSPGPVRWGSKRSRAARRSRRSSTPIAARCGPCAPISPRFRSPRRCSRCHAQQALGALKKAGARGDAYDVVFLDPPYAAGARLAPALDEQLSAVLAPKARVVSESDRRAPLALSLELETERRYGDTLIRIHRA